MQFTFLVNLTGGSAVRDFMNFTATTVGVVGGTRGRSVSGGFWPERRTQLNVFL